LGRGFRSTRYWRPSFEEPVTEAIEYAAADVAGSNTATCMVIVEAAAIFTPTNPPASLAPKEFI
jgi:hypothetical protein